MTAGRKPNPPTEAADDPSDPEKLRRGSAALTVIAKRSAEIAERFGDGLPYDRERMVTEAKYLMGQSAEAMLEAGKRLVQIKENEPWGDFTEICEKRLGINARTARKMMQAAVKYLSPALAAKRSPVTVLGRGKLFDLMVESNEDLEDLAEGGTLAGHTLDQFEAMTRRELQAVLAESRQTITAKDRLLARRDERITSLEEKLERPYQPNEKSAARTAREQAQLEELNRLVNSLELGMLGLSALCDDVFDGNCSEQLETRARQDLDYITRTIGAMLYHYNITPDFGEQLGQPNWVKDQLAAAAAKGITVEGLKAKHAAERAAKKNGKAPHA